MNHALLAKTTSMLYFIPNNENLTETGNRQHGRLALRIILLRYMNFQKRIMKLNITTPTVENHTPPLKGKRKANMLMGGSPGFCKTRLMLKSINGLLKSITNSRSAVIVIGARAMSFFCKVTENRLKTKVIMNNQERRYTGELLVLQK